MHNCTPAFSAGCFCIAGLPLLFLQAFILKFGGEEIANAGAIRGVDPFRFNPWYPVWASCVALIGVFSLLHFAPPLIRDNLFDGHGNQAQGGRYALAACSSATVDFVPV